MIFCSNPKAQYLSYKDEIDSTISHVLEKGIYILGDEVNSFEKEFADYIGVTQAIGVGSGTEALHIALKACGIGKGDEVITVSHTAVATVSAIEQTGATPVLVDIEPLYYTMDPLKLEKAITIKTKAIIPVHLYGQAADIVSILEIAQKKKLRVIEDCAQAHGAAFHNKRLGSFGDMACFSFYPTKNLGAIGDGGAIVTNSDGLAEKVRLIRQYGWRKRYISEVPGFNSRLDEIQSAILRVKLRYLDIANNKRRDIAEIYNQALLQNIKITLPLIRSGCDHVFHQYAISSEKRNELQKFLTQNGVGTLIHYPVPIHLQPAYKNKIKCSGNLKETEKLADSVLSLPIYPELTNTDISKIIKEITLFQ
jgi:dTDP-4-amino-4,6-dideoxygalactose transaminase